MIKLSQAQERNADAATRAFLSQQGITGGASARVSLSGGLPGISTPFAAATSDGNLAGNVLFVEYGSVAYRIVGYAQQASLGAYQATAAPVQQSFQTLTDPAALNAQPQHVTLVQLGLRTTIAALLGQRSSPLSGETLALINQVEIQTPLESGRLVKWVVGAPLPRASSDREQDSRLRIATIDEAQHP